MNSIRIILIYFIVLIFEQLMMTSQEMNRQAVLPVVINTWPVPNVTIQAWKTLISNGSLLDAVVAGCTVAEEDVTFTTVGWGGSPAENGETALDAMIMDGVTHSVGAVGSMKRIRNAISVARHVMEHTQHTFLVGEDATQFAKEMGFEEEDLHSNRSIEQWEEWKKKNCQPNFWKNVSPDPTSSCGPYKPIPPKGGDEKRVEFTENNHDTIGLAVVGVDGNIAAGTSTNGATFKITGRVGDSPIAGAGAYVDNDVGAAAGTGDGDIMMRFLPSYQAVENMRQGMSPTNAAIDALKRITKYYKKFEGALVVVNKQGEYGAACYGWKFQYSVINPVLKTVQINSVDPFE